MAKKYEGGWGIRVRKNVLEGNKVWLNGDKLTTVDKADKYENRDQAYDVLNNDLGDLLINGHIDCNNMAVDKLPIKPVVGRFGIKNSEGQWLDENDNFGDVKSAMVFSTRQEAECNIVDDEEKVDVLPELVNPNPDRPWDIVFDHSPVPNQLQPRPGFVYKKIDPKTKDGKAILDLIKKLFGVSF